MSTDIAPERPARRIQEVHASHPQFAAASPDEAVSAAIERPGLRLPQLVDSRPSRRHCAEWPRWSPAGSDRRRYSTR
jgi:hypothetical protein